MSYDVDTERGKGVVSSVKLLSVGEIKTYIIIDSNGLTGLKRGYNYTVVKDRLY